MDSTILLAGTVGVIFIALAFDFMNGFHDAANSIATVVSTRVLPPRAAVLWAAWWNFAAAFGFGVSVANTIGKGIVDLKPAEVGTSVAFAVIAAGLLGAIIWDAITWYYGLPSSSSHALVGGYVGAALVGIGPQVIVVSGLATVATFIVVSPIVGMILGFLIMAVVIHITRRFAPDRANKYFRRLQLVSAAFYSLSHGTNDAQKTMGIIAVVLWTAGFLDHFFVPFYVILMAHTAIALGTYFGGWRIIRTMGMRITKLKPIGGFSAESGAAITLFMNSTLGIPVSTTHTISGAIIGVGALKRLTAVRWGVARSMTSAWILTIPMSAFFAAICYALIRLFL